MKPRHPRLLIGALIAAALLTHRAQFDAASQGNEAGAQWFLARGAALHLIAGNEEAALSPARRPSSIDPSIVALLPEDQSNSATFSRELP